MPDTAHSRTGKTPTGVMWHDPSDSWWMVPSPKPHASLRLFCFPYAGASAFAFRSWIEWVPPRVEVYAIQLPGRGARFRRQLHTNVRDLVEELGPALLPMLDRRFVFFGHSLGSIIGFELARWLRRHERIAPAHLVVSGRRAPQIADSTPPTHTRPDDEFVASLRKLNGTPEEVLAAPELLRHMLPILRADCQMGETYDYVNETPLACPLTAFGGRDDEESADGRLEAWREQTVGHFAAHWCDGGHFFLHSSQERFSALLRAVLAGVA